MTAVMPWSSRSWQSLQAKRRKLAIRRIHLETPAGRTHKDCATDAEMERWLRCFREREEQHGDVKVVGTELVYP